MILICREFHWTIDEYLETEADVIDQIKQMLHIEADEREQEAKRQERKAKLKQR